MSDLTREYDHQHKELVEQIREPKALERLARAVDGLRKGETS